MKDNNITKATECHNSTQRKKIKAICPHIVVSGNIDNLYYSIQWYDIEKKSMQDGYGSFTLENVRQWLKDDFEVVDDNIDNLINRQQAEIERLKTLIVDSRGIIGHLLHRCKDIKTEAINEFMERLKAKALSTIRFGQCGVIDCYDIEKCAKEVTGDFDE